LLHDRLVHLAVLIVAANVTHNKNLPVVQLRRLWDEVARLQFRRKVAKFFKFSLPGTAQTFHLSLSHTSKSNATGLWMIGICAKPRNEACLGGNSVS
jgi:hypothetical protein